MKPLLEVQNLKTVLKSAQNWVEPIKDVSFTIFEGQTFALLGESGSGKSMTALSILQLLPAYALHGKESKILFRAQDLLNFSEIEMQKIRGKEIAMIFQDPMSSLNPVLSIGDQIGESVSIHQGFSGSALKREVLHLLDAVKIAAPDRIYQSYPHQLSGGMRQRVMIAMALAGKPKLLIADEPTTALDVTTEVQIITLMKELQQTLNTGILFITHDIHLAEVMSEQAAIMQKGRIVEQGPTDTLLKYPKNEYSRRLVNAWPKEKKVALQQEDTTKEASADVLEVENLNVFFPVKGGFFRRTVDQVRAVQEVSFSLKRGETLSLVGESGSGKSTVAKAIMALIKPTLGTVKIFGKNVQGLSKHALRCLRSEFQIIFQDPQAAMDPRLTVREIIEEGLIALKIESNRSKREVRMDHLLNEVGLSLDLKERYPHQLSGGERQRVCIARALAVGPKLLILDEPTSSLDVSVQAQIIDLLLKLQKELGLSYLFITHNIAIVRIMAHRIFIMKQGKIVESGPAADVLDNPKEAYTIALLKAASFVSNVQT